MKNNSLVIMAGGASSRMKQSLETSNLDTLVKEVAKNQHKSLIPIGDAKRPMLYYLLKNAHKAGIQKVYVITSKENSAFYDFLDSIKNEEILSKLNINFVIQYIPDEREKPLGTADALQQCLEQYENLLEENFTVCNGDNLYSEESLKELAKKRTTPNALIAYSGKALGYSEDRIAKFALLDFSEEYFLVDIIEKPSKEELKTYKSKHSELWVSMNIFNFYGGDIYPYLKKCPIDSIRNEKELPQAVQAMNHDKNRQLICIPRAEVIPDLTNADDIKNMNLYL